ncbi:MAG: permease-like cell division protein FtsX, partial [Acidimicrobiales bacterium]
ASAGQIATIAQDLRSAPQVRSIHYLDHQQSYNQAVRLFRAQRDSSVIVGALTPATTPPVFQCQLVHPGEATTVASAFEGVPGVFQVTYPAKSIRDLQQVSNVMQIVLFVIALVLLVSAIVLILNAIRMAIFARRREVGVMRLVGATAWFIRLPFMVEGLVQGILGSAIAVGVVLLGDEGIKALLHHFSLFRKAIVPGGDLVGTEILVIVIGIVVGVSGSAIAVRRFLDV